MPIRRDQKSRYPKDWAEISLRIRRDRAGWRCEDIDTNGWRCEAVHGQPHPITGSKVILTTAHLDHIPEHCWPENLRALCQLHHNRYDAATRRAGINARRKRAKGPDLFSDGETKA